MRPAALDPVARDILEAALHEFANYGFAGARIEAIVARTKTSKRMIYYHFGGKEELYKATLDYAYRKVNPDEITPKIDALPALAALATYAASAFDSFCANPDFIRLALQENLSGGTHYENLLQLRAKNRERLAIVDRILARGRAEGTIRADVTAIDVYINFVGLCAYHISALHSYRAFFDIDWSDPAVRRSRRAAICDAAIRYVSTPVNRPEAALLDGDSQAPAGARLLGEGVQPFFEVWLGDAAMNMQEAFSCRRRNKRRDVSHSKR